jgi:hypothetical protein
MQNDATGWSPHKPTPTFLVLDPRQRSDHEVVNGTRGSPTARRRWPRAEFLRGAVRFTESRGSKLGARRSAQIFIDDREPLIADVFGRHFIDDGAVGHHVKTIANAHRDVNALFDQ